MIIVVDMVVIVYMVLIDDEDHVVNQVLVVNMILIFDQVFEESPAASILSATNALSVNLDVV